MTTNDKIPQLRMLPHVAATTMGQRLLRPKVVTRHQLRQVQLWHRVTGVA